MFDVGGTLAKALITLKMYKETYGGIELPEVSLSLHELRIRDPLLKAEFVFYGEAEGIDPIAFRVKSASLYKEPEVSPPLIVNGRKVYFGASHDPKEIKALVGERLIVLYPRRDIRLLKEYEGTKYYRRRFGDPKKKFSYDLMLVKDNKKIRVKCFSARFGAIPEPFDKYMLKRDLDVEYIVALDARKGVLALMRKVGRYAIVEDVTILETEVPSIMSYIRDMGRAMIRAVTGRIERGLNKEIEEERSKNNL